MNAMGKILVIINLLFALATGGFLAVDFATRSNYAQDNDNLARELKVSRQNTDTLQETVAITVDRLKKAEDRTKKLENDLAVADKKAKELLAEAKGDAAKTKLMSEGTELMSLQTQQELERLRKEAKDLNQVIAERNRYIIKLNDERNKAQEQMDQALHERDAAQARSETLLDRLREVEKKAAAERVAAANRGGSAEGALPGAVRNPNQPNPPPAYVRATVDKVDPEDRSLVQVNAGTDAGLAVNQTLDVYRLTPEPQYLGMLRIVNASHHAAVGRMMPSRDGATRQVRVGDEVASSIQPPR